MAELKFDDLDKVFKGTTTKRYTVLVEAIAKGNPLSMQDGTNKKLTYADKTIEKLFKSGNIEKLKTDYGNKLPLFKSGSTDIKLNQIFKSSDFGGGSGSGGGAEETARNESSQCLYAALAWYVYGKQIPENQKITKADFTKAYAKCSTTETLESMIDLPEDWHKSSIWGANKLYTLYKGKTYTFHRGSNYVDKIENTFKRINKVEGAFGNLNKWSPADIYMITEKGKTAIDNDISKATNLGDLNKRMIKHYKSGDVVGVSLKKIGTSAVKFSENNIEPNKVDVTYQSTQVVAESKKSLFESMDIYLVHSKGKIQFRSFGGTVLSGWQGEGKGATANQGKISLGPLNFILKQNGVPTLPIDSASKATSPSNAYFKQFYDAAKFIQAKGLAKTQKAFEADWKVADKPWRYSKYLGILLAERIARLSVPKRHKLMTDIYLYSASKSNFAGPYAKIE